MLNMKKVPQKLGNISYSNSIGGIDPKKAKTTIINGFCRVVFNEIPLEFPTKVNQLMNLKLEGSVE